jgi:lysophospholipase L1-like esterase
MSRTNSIATRVRSRRTLPAFVLGLLVTLPYALAAENKPKENWIATWITANTDSANSVMQAIARSTNSVTEFNNQTIREIVHTTIGGSSLRIRLDNTFGSGPVTLIAVYIGAQKEGSAVVTGSNHAVTFGGKTSVTLSEGSQALSDEVPLAVKPQQDLSVSLYVSQPTGPATKHSSAFQTNYISDAGNFAAAEGSEHFTATTGSWFFLGEVDVLAIPATVGAIVALGDSITDGASTKPDTNLRWTDVLARRLAANSPKQSFAVLNAGIGGNRILSSSPCFGENAVARLDRDVFAPAGVRAVILFEGTNDIGQPDTHATALAAPCLAKTHITADDLIAGYKQIIAQVHARHFQIFGATILPFRGFNGWTEKGEATRVAANQWITNSHAFDGLIDFDAALADPRDPAKLAAQYDSGDHLHPGPIGHEAMARAIDLALFQK